MITAVVEFIAWLATFLGRRLALIITFATLISTFYATMVIIVLAATSVWVASTPEWVTQTLAMFLPSSTGAAMSAVMTARVARWVYDMSFKIAAIAVLIG